MPESSSMCKKGVFPNGTTCEYYKPNKMPEPEIKLDPMKAIPRIDLQEKFKDIAAAKSELMKQRSSLIIQTNQTIAGMDKTIAEYDGSMKTLMEFINMKKRR